MIEVASDPERQVTGRQLKEFTNMLLNRLCVKNGKRQELWLKMKRSEFYDSKRSQLKVIQYSPTDENENEDQSNVFNLGNDLGQWRIETRDVDPNTTPSKMEGVMLRRKIHKVGHKGEAVVFLSLSNFFGKRNSNLILNLLGINFFHLQFFYLNP